MTLNLLKQDSLLKDSRLTAGCHPVCQNQGLPQPLILKEASRPWKGAASLRKSGFKKNKEITCILAPYFKIVIEAAHAIEWQELTKKKKIVSISLILFHPF